LHSEIESSAGKLHLLIKGGEIRPKHASVTAISLLMPEMLLPLCQFGLQISLSMSGSQEEESYKAK